MRWIGLLAPVLLVAGCSAAAEDAGSTGDRLEECQSSALFAKIASRAQGVAGAGLVPSSLLVTQHNAAEPDVLVGGVAIFDAVADLIASAEHDVELQTWRWDIDSDPSQRVIRGIKLLEARQRERGATTPVVVRLLLNRVMPVDKSIVGRIYRQITEDPIDPTLVDLQIVDFEARGLGADHAKTVTVDGARAIVMGANVTNDYGKDPDMWDAGFRVRGEVVKSIHADFAKMWPEGKLWTCQREAEPPNDPGNAPPPVTCWSAPATPKALPPQDAPSSCVPMLVATHAHNGVPFPSTDIDNPQAQVFLGALAFAERQVLVQSPNLNEPSMKAAIVAAVRRGITVKLLLSKKFEETGESLPGRGGGNEANVSDLQTALRDLPDACSRLQIRWYSKDGQAPVEGTRPPASHVKYLSVDGQVVVVGSANQDVQSWRNSHELNVVTDNADLTRAWDRDLFATAWDRSLAVQCTP